MGICESCGDENIGTYYVLHNSKGQRIGKGFECIHCNPASFCDNGEEDDPEEEQI